MNNYKHLFIYEGATIHQAIEKLDNNDAHILLVVNNDEKLLGTVTDGDVRRGILKGIALSESIKQIMNPQPIVAQKNQTIDSIYTLMRKHVIRQIPILNDEGIVVGIEVLDELLQYNRKDNPIVLMAGGLSTRLYPLTIDKPKPMLEIAGRPILEIILTNLIQFGFHKFFISINYLGNQIKEYFGNGSKWDVEIEYLQENEKMGTAGALSLLPRKFNSPLIVMNSDLLTKIDFNHLLTFHTQHDTVATMAVRAFDYTVPYGICKFDKNYITEVVEKPTYKFFINAGVYVLEPVILDVIPKNEYFDMPTLFSRLIALEKQVTAFPVREYWLDIGQMSDFEKAHNEYSHVFEIS